LRERNRTTLHYKSQHPYTADNRVSDINKKARPQSIKPLTYYEVRKYSPNNGGLSLSLSLSQLIINYGDCESTI
jgi:hypothetical protein